MRIGFIGAGLAARTVARHLINAGHQVVLSNSRGPESLSGLIAELGPAATAATRNEAAQCEIVILSVKWTDAKDALKDIKWHGEILVDATNAHMDIPPDLSLEGIARSRAVLAAAGKTSSEIIQDLAPGARVVKSISNIPMAWINDFSNNKPKTVLFTSGDDPEAKKKVIDLLNSAGFAGIDLGSLAVGGAMHELGAPLSGLDLHLVRRLL